MSTTTLSTSVQVETDALRRALREVIAEAQDALDRLDSGSRPSLVTSGGIFGHTVDHAERAAYRLDLLLNYAGSDILPMDEAVAALKGRKGI